MIGSLPASTIADPLGSATHVRVKPAPRHFEVIVDVGSALGVASAIYGGRLGELVQHLCLKHLGKELESSRSLHLTTLVAIDNCRRDCLKCLEEQQRENSARVAAGFAR